MQTKPNTKEQSARWEGMWSRGVSRGQAFDANIPLPYISKLKDDNLIPSGKGIIPGFGRGYAIEAFAHKDLHITGVEISQTAVKSAKKYLRSRKLDPSTYTLVRVSFFEIAGKSTVLSLVKRTLSSLKMTCH